jgi:DNA-directed RNA polymerase subunit H (RpoH/RPB5)
MDVGIMKNKYLERTSYFYIKATTLFDILSEMDEAQVLDAFDIITSVDPKIEEDDPILLVKTDYTPY